MRLQVKRYIFLTLLSLTFCLPLSAQAAYLEQLAISTRANSLANSVSADPPGLMSLHYNPAGLIHLQEGLVISQDLIIPILKFEHNFSDDPDHFLLEGADEFNNDPVAGTSGEITSGRMYIPIYNDTIDFLIAGSGGVSYRAEDSRWTFANGLYVPFGGGYVHGDDDNPARFGAKAMNLQHLVYLAPSAAYRISDKLSVGLTVGAGQTALGMTISGRAPNELVAITKAVGNATRDLEIPVLSELTLPPPWFGGGLSPFEEALEINLTMRDDFSPNYNLGVLWEPNDWFAFGIAYQSPIEVQLSGSYVFKYSQEWQNVVGWLGRSPVTLMTAGILDLPHQPVAEESGNVKLDLTFPQRIQFGFMVKPIDRLKLLLDFHWAEWSELDKFDVQFDKDLQFLRFIKLLGYTGGNDRLVMERQLRDKWNISVGLEYQLLDWLALRFGYADRKSSITLGRHDLMSLPDLDVFSTGAGINLPNGMIIDLGFTYMLNKSFEIPNNGSKNLNSTTFTDVIYNPYNGLNYDGDFEVFIFSAGMTVPFEVMQAQMDHALALLLGPFGIEYNPHRAEKVEAADLEKALPATLATTDSPAAGRPAAPSGALVEITLPYSLRLAQFAEPGRAQAASSYYTANGIAPYVVQTTAESGDTLWQLHQGSYATQQEAFEAKKSLLLAEASVIFTPYACQVGAFESRQDSQATFRLLTDLGYAPYSIEDEDGKVRLLTGAFESFEEARKLNAQIASQGLEASVVHRAIYMLPDQAPAASGDQIPAWMATPQFAAGQMPYSLRLAHFTDESRARMALFYYRTDGLEPYLVKEDGIEGSRWTLYVGAYQTGQEAFEARGSHLLNEAEPALTPYACLAGRYETQSDADAALEQLAEMGYFPYTLTDDLGNICLLVGAFAEQEEAERLSAALTAQGITASVVLRSLSMQTVPSASGPFPYSLQLAGFQSESRAKMALTYYQTEDVVSYLVKTEQGGTPFWTICTGSYRSEEEALQEKARLDLMESLPIHTPYACEIGVYQEGEEPPAGTLESLEKLGYTPYTIPGRDGAVRLLIGAFATWNQAESLNFQLDVNGIQNRIVER